MRTNLLFAVLAGTILALAGCSPDPKPYPKYDAAADFKDDAPANATVAGGFPSVFVDKDGKTIDLKSFRGKKSVVVVVLRGVVEPTIIYSWMARGRRPWIATCCHSHRVLG